MKPLKIADKTFTSRLFTGTGKFSSNEKMEEAIIASESQLVTVAMKRIRTEDKNDDMLRHILRPGVQLLPNTSGVRDAKEAVFAAQLSREAFETNWLKLEIHPDPRYLLPDPIETLKATEELAKMGFIVLPYCQADPVLCKRLEDAGAATVMPLGAPIGSNQGLQTREFLRIIIEQSNIPVVVEWKWVRTPCWSTRPLPLPTTPWKWQKPLKWQSKPDAWRMKPDWQAKTNWQKPAAPSRLFWIKNRTTFYRHNVCFQMN